MIRQLSLDHARLLRLRSQRLQVGPAPAKDDPAQLVHAICAMQSQELPAATLGMRARSHGLVVNDVKAAREIDRSIVLTWAMRGTMHLVAARDLAWMLPLFGPRFINQSQRRYRQLGLDDAIRSRASDLMRDELHQRGPLTRGELAAALDAHDIPVVGQAIAHLVRFAALSGVICVGPERDGELTYVALDDWLGAESGPKLDSEESLATLARRYLQAYGPASPGDLASWSGLTKTQARAGFKAIADATVTVEVMGAPAWMLEEHVARMDEAHDGPAVRLLPRYDGYLLGYAKRDFIVPDDHAKRVHPGGGLIRQTVIVDGVAVATWRSERKTHSTTIVIEPFEALDPGITPYLEAEARDMERFLQHKMELEIL